MLMSNGGGGVQQAVLNLTPGQQYVVSAWVNVTAGNAAALLVDDASNSATQQVATQGATNGWQFISLPFTADSSGMMNIHLISDATGAIYWDDISVVPEIGLFTISGQVTGGGSGLSGATVSLTGNAADGSNVSQTTSTDSNGNYSLFVSGGGTYTVTPSASGYTFNPNSQQFTNVSNNNTQNFAVSTESSTPTGSPQPQPPPQSAPTPVPPSVSSASTQNCNDISGTWTDGVANNYALSQSGSLVSGTITTYDACGSFNSSIQGNATGTGTFSLTATAPSTDSCGDPITTRTANISLTIELLSCPSNHHVRRIQGLWISGLWRKYVRHNNLVTYVHSSCNDRISGRKRRQSKHYFERAKQIRNIVE